MSLSPVNLYPQAILRPRVPQTSAPLGLILPGLSGELPIEAQSATVPVESTDFNHAYIEQIQVADHHQHSIDIAWRIAVAG
jgi:hypothetical protein